MNGGRGRREAQSPLLRGGNLALCLILIPLALGCGKKEAGRDGKREKPEKPILQSVGFGAGSTVVYVSSAPKAPPSFTVQWQKGAIDATDGGIDTGRLETVSGDLFSQGKKTSDYSAAWGEAHQDTKRLTLSGDVTLRSADGRGTLTAPKAEYRGDVKLVRAMGGVTASGPFGTLSGVPELWATPDLQLIGTPDMVSQKLKIPALVALAATAATGAARIQNPNYELTNALPAIENLGNDRLRITAKPVPGGGPVTVSMASRGLVIKSSGVIVVEYDRKLKAVRHLKADGAVSVVQTAKNGSTTTLDGRGATYDGQPNAQTGRLDLGGKVKIVRTAKVKNAAGAMVTQTTTTLGDKGSAVLLNQPKANEDPLKAATLTGNVSLNVSEVDGETFSGRAERLVYTPSGETSNVDMAGGATLTRTSKKEDGSTSAVVAKGVRGVAELYSRPNPGANPLKSATLDGDVSIDVSGSNGDTFKGSGDRLVFTEAGGGGKVVMTGALEFSGDAAEFVGNLTNVDTAIMTIGKQGWERIETSNSGGVKAKTSILPKDKPKKGGPKR